MGPFFRPTMFSRRREPRPKIGRPRVRFWGGSHPPYRCSGVVALVPNRLPPYLGTCLLWWQVFECLQLSHADVPTMAPTSQPLVLVLPLHRSPARCGGRLAMHLHAMQAPENNRAPGCDTLFHILLSDPCLQINLNLKLSRFPVGCHLPFGPGFKRRFSPLNRRSGIPPCFQNPLASTQVAAAHRIKASESDGRVRTAIVTSDQCSCRVPLQRRLKSPLFTVSAAAVSSPPLFRQMFNLSAEHLPPGFRGRIIWQGM